ncbi:hypothetical protein OL229_21590 [Neisseriaceae bacterium JH1-16]|nr:hypothetical protein [Neisseriaceae bacterium JH1-16]
MTLKTVLSTPQAYHPSTYLTPTPRTSNGLADCYTDILGGEPLNDNVIKVFTTNSDGNLVIPAEDGGGEITWVRGAWAENVKFRYQAFMAPPADAGATNYLDVDHGASAVNRFENGVRNTLLTTVPGTPPNTPLRVYFNRRSGILTQRGEAVAGWPMLHTEPYQGTANDGDLYLMWSLDMAHKATGLPKYARLRDRIGQALLEAGRWVGNEINFGLPLEAEAGEIGLYEFYGDTTPLSWAIEPRPSGGGNCLHIQTAVPSGGPPYHYAGWGAWPSWRITEAEPFLSFDFELASDGSERSLELSSNVFASGDPAGEVAVRVPLFPAEAGVFVPHSFSASDFWKLSNVVFEAKHKAFSYSGSYGSDAHSLAEVADLAERAYVPLFSFDFSANDSGYAGMYFGSGNTDSSNTTSVTFDLSSSVTGQVRVLFEDANGKDWSATIPVTTGVRAAHTFNWTDLGAVAHPIAEVTVKPWDHEAGSYRLYGMWYDSPVTMADSHPEVFGGFEFSFPSYESGAPYDVRFARIKVNNAIQDGPVHDPQRYMGVPRWTYKWIGSDDAIGFGAWRGPTAVGYNWLPGWIDSDVVNPDNGRSMIAMMRQFMLDAQAEYKVQFPNATHPIGPMMPRYGRASWEAITTGGWIAGQWSKTTYNRWYHPDTDDWYGYTVRALVSCAADYYQSPTPEMKALLDHWMAWFDLGETQPELGVGIKADGNHWWPPSGYGNDGLPTYSYRPVYAYTMIAQAMIFKYWVDGDPIAKKWYRRLLDDMFARKRLTDTGKLAGISRTTEGDGYTTATVVIDGDGRGAAATAHVFGGKVRYYAIEHTGSGYTWATATVVGDGTGATCHPYLSDQLVGAFSDAHTGWEVFDIYNTYAMLVLGHVPGGTVNFPTQVTADDIAALDGLEAFFAHNTTDQRPSIFTADGAPVHEYDVDPYHNGRGIEGPMVRDTHAKGAMWTETIGPSLRAAVFYSLRHSDYGWLDRLYRLTVEMTGGKH